MRVGRLIRDTRKQAHLSQAALAARAGTSQPAVARYESNIATPSLSTLERLLLACGSRLVVTSGRTLRGSTEQHAGHRLRAISRARNRLLAAARRHGIRDVRLFGSVARGNDTAESDIDFLVDLDAERTLIDLIAFRQEAEDILGVPVDAVAPRFMKNRIRARAERDARRL